MEQTLTPTRICCVYTAKDEASYISFEKQFRFLLQQGALSSYWGRKIPSQGQDAYDKIDLFHDTQIVFLMVTSAFLASSYGESPEVKHLIEQQQSGKIRVFPLVLPYLLYSTWSSKASSSLRHFSLDSVIMLPDFGRSVASSHIEGIIQRAQEDLSRFAVTKTYSALPSIWHVPYPRLTGFLGRESLLTHLENFFQASQEKNRSHILYGIPGVGKTQVAIEYLYRYAHNYQVIFWVNAETQDTLLDSFIGIATLLGLPEQQQRDRSKCIEAVKQWLYTHTKWLLVIDDVEDIRSLQSFLPETYTGHILVTTAASLPETTDAHTKIEPFSNEEGAVCFLRKAMLLDAHTGLDGVSGNDRQLALRISQELNNLPLALEEAGAYIEVQRISLEDFLRRYQRARQDLLKKNKDLVNSPSSPALITTYLIFQLKLFFVGAQFLRLCTFLGTAGIPEVIFINRTSNIPWHARFSLLPNNDFAFASASYVAQTYALMRRDFPTKTLYFHRVTQQFAEKTISHRQRKQLLLQAIYSMNAGFLKVDVTQWGLCEFYLPQALACIRFIRQEHITALAAGYLLDHTAQYLQERMAYSEATIYFQEALKIYRKRLGTHHQNTKRVLDSYNALVKGQQNA